MEWFEFQVRGKVIRAEHCPDTIGLEMDKAGGTRVLLVTDRGVRDAGLDKAVANALLGIVHAMSNACGGRFGAAHGATNAVLLPYAGERECDEVLEVLKRAY